jgi:hypothetical protein
MTVIDMTVIEYPWDKPPARLTADEVHVWHAELDLWVEWVPWLTQILFPESLGSSAVAAERWSMHEPTVAPGYVAAIVVAGGSDACVYSPSPNAEGGSWSRSHAPH